MNNDDHSTHAQHLVQQMCSAVPTGTNTDPQLRAWLGLTESMTAAVAHHCRGQATVTLLQEGVGQAQHWERQHLNCADDVFVRHICLSVHGVPRLAARSLTANNSSVVGLMQGLGEQPLAQLLFSDPLWRRAADVEPLRSADGLPGRGVLWCHHNHAQGLLVEEFFLPALLQPTTN